MNAITFDTLKLARKLETAGFPPKQAQDASAALAESIAEWHGNSNLATEESLHKLEVGLDAKIVQTEMRLETKIAEAKVELVKWVLGVGFAQAAMMLAALRFHG